MQTSSNESKISSRMGSIRSKKTKPERMIAAILVKLGVKFSCNVRTLPGTPDFVIQGTKKIIFVHGCFWHRHGCKKSSTPKTNTDFWIRKFAKNVRRDRAVVARLRRSGWSVLTLWECKLCDSRGLFRVLLSFLGRRSSKRNLNNSQTPSMTRDLCEPRSE